MDNLQSTESKRQRKPRPHHGERNSPEYITWKCMKARCTNKKHDGYKYYGAKGISVCTRWFDSFALFLADVGRKPSSKHQLDRIRSDGNYEPGNVRWATSSENNRNKGNNLLVRFRGEERTLVEWSEILGVNETTLWNRLMIANMPPEKAFTKKLVWEAAIKVLRDTGNQSVMWGDVRLLNLIADEAGIEPNGPETQGRILEALRKNSGPLIKSKRMVGGKACSTYSLPQDPNQPPTAR